MKYLLAGIALLTSCSATSAEDVLRRAGLWEVSVELAAIDFPGMSPAEEKRLLKERQAAMSAEPSRQCWGARTASNYLRVGDVFDLLPDAGVTCRYTVVETPGDPVSRTAECRSPDGQLRAVATTRGTATPAEYSYEIEMLDPASGRKVTTVERGRWLSADCASG